ncbi:unnamed protein product [Adineta ricciae]|uniref:Apple domain-containing protein n=1 Tax=Adineta ricciae TaxID=249248 RepID=A0A814VNZ8_ADIRI|nr:unnamed protein product [Adineta ricciae]CAF1582673.1 unnamed protein product [Adineta ricciae]
MIWTRIFALFSAVIFDLVFTQNTNSILMNIMDGWQFQCATTTCLPYATVTAYSIFQCQSSCLRQSQCMAITFRQSISECQLFTNYTEQNSSLETAVNTVTMRVIPGTRIPSVSITTSTSTTTTTSSSSTSATTSTSSSTSTTTSSSSSSTSTTTTTSSSTSSSTSATTSTSSLTSTTTTTTSSTSSSTSATTLSTGM